jgi:hypothetical protein
VPTLRAIESFPITARRITCYNELMELMELMELIARSSSGDARNRRLRQRS